MILGDVRSNPSIHVQIQTRGNAEQQACVGNFIRKGLPAQPHWMVPTQSSQRGLLRLDEANECMGTWGRTDPNYDFDLPLEMYYNACDPILLLSTGFLFTS